jgi:hypothetical protein
MWTLNVGPKTSSVITLQWPFLHLEIRLVDCYISQGLWATYVLTISRELLKLLKLEHALVTLRSRYHGRGN